MVHPFVLAALLAAIAGLASAQETGPISADEFDAYTHGKTLYYAEDGLPFGIEEYLDGRRVRWSFLDGECHDGIWYPAGEMICFVYDNFPEPQCWTFYGAPGGLTARFENSTEATSLYETHISREDLICLGPRTGV